MSKMYQKLWKELMKESFEPTEWYTREELTADAERKKPRFTPPTLIVIPPRRPDLPPVPGHIDPWLGIAGEE